MWVGVTARVCSRAWLWFRMGSVGTHRGLSRISWLMNLGMIFSGYWWGPYTLLPRVMITGRLKDLWYAFTYDTGMQTTH